MTPARGCREFVEVVNEANYPRCHDLRLLGMFKRGIPSSLGWG